MSTFKAFSSKSNARRGIAAAHKAAGWDTVGAEHLESLLSQDAEGKWGFNPDMVVVPATPVAEPVVETVAAAPVAPATTPNAFTLAARKPAAAPVADVQPELALEEAAETPVDTTGAFGALAASLQTTPLAPRTQAAAAAASTDRGGYKVEKDRPKQNGVARPSKDGKCRQVWDLCDALREAGKGVPPEAKVLRAQSEANGWNLNNTMIEFYQWRKFNGIKGRAAKAAA